jgi:hypothetical protein
MGKRPTKTTEASASRQLFIFTFPSLYFTVSSWVKSMKPNKYWQTQELSGAIADPVNSDSDAERLNSCERKAYLLDIGSAALLGKVQKYSIH